MRGFLQGCRSRGLKRRPLLQTSSPLKPRKSTRGLTPRLVQQTGALQTLAHSYEDSNVFPLWMKLSEIRRGAVNDRVLVSAHGSCSCPLHSPNLRVQFCSERAYGLV
jgi:hypothetical protein